MPKDIQKELKPNYCFWCSAYGLDNFPRCMNCGNKLDTYPPELEALIAKEVKAARIDELERLPGNVADLRGYLPKRRQALQEGDKDE